MTSIHVRSVRVDVSSPVEKVSDDIILVQNDHRLRSHHDRHDRAILSQQSVRTPTQMQRRWLTYTFSPSHQEPSACPPWEADGGFLRSARLEGLLDHRLSTAVCWTTTRAGMMTTGLIIPTTLCSSTINVATDYSRGFEEHIRIVGNFCLITKMSCPAQQIHINDLCVRHFERSMA
jgi:hypothetical protein